MSYITASRCTLCGDGIYLHVDGYGQTALDRIDGQLLTTDRSDPHHPQPRTVLIEHACDPSTREAHDARMLTTLDALERHLIENPIEAEPITEQQLQELREKAGQDDETHRTAVREVHDELTRLSFDRGCSRCGAEVGAPCQNLAKRKQGIVQATKNPHPERIPDVDPRNQERLQKLHEVSTSTRDLLERLEESIQERAALGRIESLLKEIRDRI